MEACARKDTHKAKWTFFLKRLCSLTLCTAFQFTLLAFQTLASRLAKLLNNVTIRVAIHQWITSFTNLNIVTVRYIIYILDIKIHLLIKKYNRNETFKNINCERSVNTDLFLTIVGFHLTSLKFKLQNHLSYWDFLLSWCIRAAEN